MRISKLLLQKVPQTFSVASAPLKPPGGTLDRPAPSQHPSSSIASLERQLASAQLKVAQLQLAPHSQAMKELLERLKTTEQDLVTMVSEFRYTQLSLRAHHDAIREELRESLAIASCKDDASLRRAAVRASMEQSLRQNVGFRALKVSEAAPVTLARKQDGDATPSDLEDTV